MSPDPVSVSARDARVEIDGAIACDRLGFEAAGARTVIAGGAAPAFAAALTGRGKVVSGAITVDGLEVTDGSHFGRIGIAPLDPPMPASSAARDYVALSLRIAGTSERHALRDAAELLGLLGLQQVAGRRTSALALAEKRVLAIAAAMIPKSRVMFAEAPLAGLEPAGASFVLNALAAASRTRAILTTALRVDPLAPERALLAGSDRIVLLAGEALAWSGDPGELVLSQRQLFLLQIRGEIEAFLAAAREASIDVQGSPPRVVVRLPEGMPQHRLFALAESAQAVILELLPVWPGGS